MNRNELNEVYKKLESKMHELTTLFNSLHKGFQYTCAYYSGHYYKNADGNYEMDYFPIPVISITNICDIEIGLDSISLSTKLKRATAIQFDYDKLSEYNFEAYGVKKYLEDYYAEGNTYAELVSNIEKSSEKEIGFSFQFSCDLEADKLYELVKFLRKEGFYY